MRNKLTEDRQTKSRSILDPLQQESAYGLANSLAKPFANPHLHNVYARIQEDASFGFLGNLLIFVGIEDVRAIWKLRQVEVPFLEHLLRKRKKSSPLEMVDLPV